MIDPTNPREWQLAVNFAEFSLYLEDCRLYGLLSGTPTVNVDRCLEVLRRGKQMGIVPLPLDDLILFFLGGRR